MGTGRIRITPSALTITDVISFVNRFLSIIDIFLLKDGLAAGDENPP
jgi:hypothetical protein